MRTDAPIATHTEKSTQIEEPTCTLSTRVRVHLRARGGGGRELQQTASSNSTFLMTYRYPHGARVADFAHKLQDTAH